MDADIRNNKFIRPQLIALSFLGFVQFNDQYKYEVRHYWGILVIISIGIFNFLQYVFVVINWGDIEKISLNGGTALLMTTLIAKVGGLIAHKDKYFNLMERMHLNMKLIHACSYPKVVEILKYHTNFSSKLTNVICPSMVASLVLYVIYICLYFLYIRQPGDPVEPMCFTIWYPFDSVKYDKFALLITLWFTVFNAIVVPFYNTFIMSLMTYCCCQLRILQYCIEHMDEFIINKDVSKSVPSKISLEDKRLDYLIACVKSHCLIISYVEDLRDLISLPMALDFNMFVILMCTQMLNFFSMKLNMEAVLNVMYLMSMFALVFSYYWHANDILLESEKVSICVYLCPWVSSGSRFRATSRLMILRAQRPLVFKAGLQNMTLETLIMILRASYRAFALLRQVQETL